jgi:hypothetical protein
MRKAAWAGISVAALLVTSVPADADTVGIGNFIYFLDSQGVGPTFLIINDSASTLADGGVSFISGDVLLSDSSGDSLDLPFGSTVPGGTTIDADGGSVSVAFFNAVLPQLIGGTAVLTLVLDPNSIYGADTVQVDPIQLSFSENPLDTPPTWNDLGSSDTAPTINLVTPTATVPEPSTLLLLASGLAACAFGARARRTQRAPAAHL